MILASARLSSAFEKEMIVSYCNGQPIENIELLKADIEESLAYINKQLIFFDGFERFHVGYNVKEKDGAIENIQLVFSFKPHNSSPEQYYMYIKRDSFKEFQSTFENSIKFIVEGSKAIAETNTIIRNIQEEIGAPLAIEYKWAISDKLCRIGDWDYNRIKVKLNRSSIHSLIDMYNNNILKSTIENSKWNLNIKEFIENFNHLEFHKAICAMLKSNDLVTILTENMLDTRDVLAVIRRNKNSQGKQSLKSVTAINELGRFLVVSKWNVDYTNKIINMSIMDDKILDIDSGRFIMDNTICSKIQEKIMIPQSIIDMIFDSNVEIP